MGGIEYSYKKGMLYKTNCQALSFPRKYLIALHAPSPAFPVGMQLIVHTSRTDTTGCKRVLLRADLALWLPSNYLLQHHPLQYYYVQTWLCGCPIIICYNTTLCNTNIVSAKGYLRYLFVFQAELSTAFGEVQGLLGTKHITHVLLRRSIVEGHVLIHHLVSFIRVN